MVATGQTPVSKFCQASSCLVFADPPLAEESHMAKLSVSVEMDKGMELVFKSLTV